MQRKRGCVEADELLVRGFSQTRYSVILIPEKLFPSWNNAFWEIVPTDSTVSDSYCVFLFFSSYLLLSLGFAESWKK